MNDIDSRIQNQFDASESLYEQMQEEILNLRALAELLEWASEECATITCEAFPQNDGGDYEQAWCVYAHHLNEDEARCIGAGATIEEALRKARENEKQTTPPHPYTCEICKKSAHELQDGNFLWRMNVGETPSRWRCQDHKHSHACDCGGSPHGDHCNAVENGNETSELRCEVCGQHVENCDHAQSDEAISGGKFKSMHKALRDEFKKSVISHSSPTKYCEKCDVFANWSSADCPVCLQDLQEMDFFFHSNPDEPGALTVTNNTDIIQGRLFDRMHHALTYDEKLRAELIAAMQRAKI